MRIKKTGVGVVAAVAGLMLAGPSYAGKPDIFRFISEFNFPIVDCGSFQVRTSGWERDTEKLWYNELGEPVMLHISISITEGQYYNNVEPDKFVVQGKKGVGENATIRINLITGDEHNTGGQFRLTIPGIGHVLLDAGTWFWDASEEALIHHGPDFALAEGETGLALCEALE
jgi:hypothetical protein